MQTDLLPGVTTTQCPPVVICDSAVAVRAARRRTMIREVVQLILLVLVDGLFVRWPSARFPALERGASVKLLVALNILLVVSLWLVRLFPRVRAKRIAKTWEAPEKRRFEERPERPVRKANE